MLHGAQDREIPQGARDDVRCEPLRVKIIFWLLIIFCQVSFAQPTAAFFYGQSVPSMQLCLYELAVVDPYSDFNPKNYCHSISKPIAYISLGEVAVDAPYIKDIRDEWVMGKNVAWNENKVIDQTQKDWQDYVLNQMIDPLWNKGYRGFFLDTLDSYLLANRDPLQQQQQIDSMVSLIQQIKKRHPEATIILNRGFHLLPQVHAQIDAVVIESLYHSWNQKLRTYETTPHSDQKMLLNEIDKIKKMQLSVIVIDYLPPEQQKTAQSLATDLEQQGLIPWITDKTVQSFYLTKMKEMPRKILVLFNDNDKLPLQSVARLSYIDIVLEYMGYVTKYLNIHEHKDLPKGDLSQQYAGIILHFDEESNNNESLMLWLKKQIANKIPIVFTNTFTVPRDNKILSQFNLLITPINHATTEAHITQLDPNFIGYDMNPIAAPFEFNPLRASSSQVLLQIMNDTGQIEDAVAITPWGGYALSPYFIQHPPNYRTLWVINPFNFLRKALRLTVLPVPDVTTENGRRLMTVHVDGDGFSLKARWIGGSFAAKELYERILKRFTIPTSVSVITGEIAPNGSNPKQSPRLMRLTRSIFALPWVEIASHGFSHPFNWQLHQGKDKQIQGEHYTVTIPNYKFNLETEITGSVNFINNHLSPANKKCTLFFWSGMADPSIEAMTIAARAHLLSINGLPDTFINQVEPSITGVTPMGMELGQYYQVFSPIAADFYYINNPPGLMYGYKKVIQTLQLTDKPRRLKPIDLYYHIYSAGYPASLTALTEVYQWALAQSVMNIYISDYIKKVLDYYHTTIAKKDDLWIIKTVGEIRELRSKLNLGYPDLIKSHNVIGYRLINNNLYIHLGGEQYTVLSYQKEKPLQSYLVEANGTVTSFSRIQNQLIIKMKGYMPLQFTLDNVTHCQVSAQNPLKIIHNQDHTISYSSLKKRDEIHINC